MPSTISSTNYIHMYICHRANMVTAVRAHCNHLDIYIYIYIYIYILQVDLVGNWLLYSISEEMSSNLNRFLNLFNKFFSGLTRIRTHAQVVHASWCCLARRRANQPFCQVGMAEGKGQACKVLLPTHDAFHFYTASRFGWQLVII